MICPYCGKTIQDGLMNCPFCGNETQFSSRFHYVPSRTPISDDGGKDTLEESEKAFSELNYRLKSLEAGFRTLQEGYLETSRREAQKRKSSLTIQTVIAAMTVLIVCVGFLAGIVSMKKGWEKERLAAKRAQEELLSLLEERLPAAPAEIPADEPVEEQIPEILLYWNQPGDDTADPFVTSADAPLPTVTFAPEGYSFAGWNTSPDGKGEQFAVGDHTAVTPLYAVWMESAPMMDSEETVG